MMKRDRKLTAEQVREIKENPLPAKAIAPYFGVSPRTIRAIRTGETYKENDNDNRATHRTA